MKTVYLDMDGVIADFLYQLLWEHNREDLITRYEEGTFPNDWDLEGELGTEEQLYSVVRKLGRSFWINIPPYPWMTKLLNCVNNFCKIHKANWYICTTPYYQSDCYKGKVDWLHANLGQQFSNIIMIRDKYLLANKNSFLIDDSEKNYDNFIKNGGNAFLFPQQWNRAREQKSDTFNILNHCLSSFLYQEKPVNVTV